MFFLTFLSQKNGHYPSSNKSRTEPSLWPRISKSSVGSHGTTSWMQAVKPAAIHALRRKKCNPLQTFINVAYAAEPTIGNTSSALPVTQKTNELKLQRMTIGPALPVQTRPLLSSIKGQSTHKKDSLRLLGYPYGCLRISYKLGDASTKIAGIPSHRR